ncbi:MFS transporter [Streptomyces sp. NPDC090106]|uniref:MFS transporter n=1 Tax=Streptomyces sp. NPDC090106 TaxID=3365946 RepID=UPI0038213605
MTGGRTLLLAVTAGTAIANNYAVQPALTDVAAEFGVPLPVIGLVPTAALLGCMTGFVLLLPLADRIPPNRLIPVQLGALAAALCLAAAAPGATVLLVAYLLIGATAGVAAQAGAIAGRLAPPGRRTHAVATVAAGMSAGILLSRLVGGTLADAFGWRHMLLLSAAAVTLCALTTARLLPPTHPGAELPATAPAADADTRQPGTAPAPPTPSALHRATATAPPTAGPSHTAPAPPADTPASPGTPPLPSTLSALHRSTATAPPTAGLCHTVPAPPADTPASPGTPPLPSAPSALRRSTATAPPTAGLCHTVPAPPADTPASPGTPPLPSAPSALHRSMATAPPTAGLCHTAPAPPADTPASPGTPPLPPAPGPSAAAATSTDVRPPTDTPSSGARATSSPGTAAPAGTTTAAQADTTTAALAGTTAAAPPPGNALPSAAWADSADSADAASPPPPTPTPTYLATLRALPRLLRRHPALRWAVVAGGLWYLAFNLVWVALALELGRAPYSLDATGIGLYSLAGLLGFGALPLAGRLADRYSPRAVITASLLVGAAGAGLLATGLHRPAVTVLGLALFDAGAFAAQAANQSRVMALDPARGGSLVSVYLVLYFTVGAAGTTLAAPLIENLGWSGTALTALAALLAAVAVVLTRTGARSGSPQGA